GVAESFVFSDPQSASLKIRSLLETLVKDVYRINRFYLDRNARFVDWLTSAEFESVVSASILELMHAVRKSANKQIHSEAPKREKPAIALSSLAALYNITRWYFLAHLGGDKGSLPSQFQQPTQSDPEAAIAVQGALKKAVQDLEARNKAMSVELERAIAENKGAKHSHSELQELKAASDKYAETLGFNEEETRVRLVDTMIAKAGWDLSDENQVRVEEHVDHQPTATGSGYVDYVLWDSDGSPLAVVEAKRVAVSAADAREQAMIYAEALHKKHGVKPFVFYSNGIETYFLNWPGNEVPRRVYGIYSRESLRKLRREVDEGLVLAEVEPDLSIADRLHSLEAIKRVTESLDSGRRKALIALATGTGKTRVAISIADIILRAHWGKRILFLCDRVELREQAAQDFKRFLPDVTVAEFSSHSKEDKKTRIFVATYPSFHNHFENFDIGHFDLIICDEAHRTTGATLDGQEESNFVRVHRDDVVGGDKRLYMTATPRI
ncbi:MAG: DEAD/DEAH box helicase family protein, partial [Planctomycetes bacterium]|nr:DEAD/DEAH box helicase family protein [Planctomycetota bacterium]